MRSSLPGLIAPLSVALAAYEAAAWLLHLPTVTDLVAREPLARVLIGGWWVLLGAHLWWRAYMETDVESAAGGEVIWYSPGVETIQASGKFP